MTPHGGNLRALAAKAGCAPEDILDFSASINPLGPPPWLRTHISAHVSALAHYPDPACTAFLQAASERLGVPADRLLAGNGTSELLFAVAAALGGNMGHTRAVIPAPCYADYAAACLRAGMNVETLPLREASDFRLDLDALAWRLESPAVVIVGRPNNPTGHDVSATDLLAQARAHPDSFFVADEAFGSFVPGFESLMACGAPNVAVLASLTKMYAVPGLRLGLLGGGAAFVRAVAGRIAPWSVNVLAQAVGQRAMQDRDFDDETRLAVAGLRAGLVAGLSGLAGVRVYPGLANYVLCRLDAPGAAPSEAEGSAGALAARLLAEDRIAIRTCANFQGLDDRYFRLAVRTAEENERLVAALWRILAPRTARRPGRARRTPALMVQGATSNAGKSVLTAALCRILRQDGVDVAPFKAQNMSLNSFVTAWGEEMGRAQVLQAQAAGLAPRALMNPVLLKPCSDTGSQVIVMGKPVGNMRVAQYVAYKPTAFAAAKKAYDTLAGTHQAVILEGAGSPAEVNLKAHDIVNMAMARYAKARVLLVGDIDRGGVFAALAGTMEVLPEDERALVGGFVLNRFRGDPALLKSAHAFMQALTGKKVLGVVPNINDLGLPEEDSVSFKDCGFNSAAGRDLDIAVVDLAHISNFTDFDALGAEPDVGLRAVRSPAELGRPDALILPGSKNTLADLAGLERNGLAAEIVRLAGEGMQVVGVCAGFQMLGLTLADPLGLESAQASRAGLGLLPLETELLAEKTLAQVRGEHTPSGQPVWGYEIHHGVTRLAGGDAPALIVGQDGRALGFGRVGGVWGTYLHGVFDAPGFRRWWLNALRAAKGLAPLAPTEDGLEAALDRLALVVRQSMDMTAVYRLLGL